MTTNEPTTVEVLVTDDTRGHFHRGQALRRPCGPNDVSIAIHYAGICHSDYHNAKAEWGGMAIYPMVPGHEIAGIVDGVGSKVTKFKVGDRVGVGCFIDSCRSCDHCKKGEGQYCTGSEPNPMVLTYNSGLTDKYADSKGYPKSATKGGVKLLAEREVSTFGGYSQKIVVDEGYVCTIPEKLPLEHAAPLLCAGITTYSPLAYYGARDGGKGFKVAIIGLGGLGDMGAKISKCMGNDVTVISTSERKREYAEKTLDVKFVNSKDPAQMAAAAGSFDLIICTISSQFDIAPYLSLVKTSGKMCLVGAPPNDLSINVFPLIFRRLTICGSLIGGIPETQEMLDFCSEHQIWSEVEHIKASEVNRAFCELGTNAANKQRFVIDVKDSLVPGDWEVDTSMLKSSAKHVVNKYCQVVGAENTAGKTYDPAKDTFA